MMKTRTLYRNPVIRILLYPVVLLLILYTLHFTADLLTPLETTAADSAAAADYLEKQNLPTPPMDFVRDGCTLWPDALPGHDFGEACLAHYIGYWAGGSSEQKYHVNQTFKRDIAESGPAGPALAIVMHTGVTWFGDNGVSRVISSHWGFGWD